MSPTSSKISTTQRLLKSSSRSNPAARCSRTCMTQKSVSTPSAERSLHHCSLRSEKSQRTVDKLITLLKKVYEQIRILLERHKEQILAGCRAEIQKHEFQADYDRRNIQELSGIIDSQQREIDHTLMLVMNIPDDINNKIGIFVKLI